AVRPRVLKSAETSIKSAFRRAADLAQQGRKILDAPKCACGFPALFRVVIDTSKRRFPSGRRRDKLRFIVQHIEAKAAVCLCLVAPASEPVPVSLGLTHEGREKQNPSLWMPGQARHDKQKQS
ncbi:hypothetical protein, partial [Cloacibacillus sp.]|uniref:hypothetical protein n=1 Tax=Cloacibacillus sp. TaxID=2049023 RepID=UPI0025B89D92